MRRREFIRLIGGAAVAWPIAVAAETSVQHPTVGVLLGASTQTGSRWIGGFLQGLRELGYVDGQNIDIIQRYAGGEIEQLPRLAGELVKVRPAVIVAGPIVAALAVKQLTATIPIVCPAMTDPIGLGLVTSYARPGGQATGLMTTLDTLPGKQLEVGLEIVPGAQKVGVLIDKGNPSNTIAWRDTEASAALLKLDLVPIEVRTADELDTAIEAFARERAELLIVLQDTMFLSQRRRLAALAEAARLPTMYGFRDHVEAGGLISYGFDLRDNFRRAAAFVDKILKGARPGELPVELPTKLELVVNLRTAKVIGLTIPETFLVRADEVIE
jgi:putative ABC transport system substrate-binding protein